MNFKKIWNNRTFRTFVQVFLGTIAAYFADYTFEIESKKIICLIIMATSTAFTKIMPLLEENKTVSNTTEQVQDANIQENAATEKQDEGVQEEVKND